MKKYFVKIDRSAITTYYYRVEAESEEEALRIAAHGGEKVKFLFDSVRDGGEGKPEIERRPIEIVRREAAESKCCLDCSTGLYIGLDCDGDPRDLGKSEPRPISPIEAKIERGFAFFDDPRDDNGFLSWKYPSSFEIDGLKFSSAEQYMEHREALMFGDQEADRLIMSADSDTRIAVLGASVRGLDESKWMAAVPGIMADALGAKFRQNPELARGLLSTGDAVLVACGNRYGRFGGAWGISVPMGDPRRFDREEWTGDNLLGETLMALRASIREEKKKSEENA